MHKDQEIKNQRSQVESVLNSYDIVTLKQLEDVGLLNRVDHKRTWRIVSLPDLLEKLKR